MGKVLISLSFYEYACLDYNCFHNYFERYSIHKCKVGDRFEKKIIFKAWDAKRNDGPKPLNI